MTHLFESPLKISSRVAPVPETLAGAWKITT